jgi:hypothetical protein
MAGFGGKKWCVYTTTARLLLKRCCVSVTVLWDNHGEMTAMAGSAGVSTDSNRNAKVSFRGEP